MAPSVSISKRAQGVYDLVLLAKSQGYYEWADRLLEEYMKEVRG